MKNAPTAHNKRYTLPAGQARLQGLHSPRSLRSHGSFHPHFCNPGLCFAKPLFGLQKRRIPRTLCERKNKLELKI